MTEAPVALGAVIIGMGRSGTSLTTSTLVAAGFFAGASCELLAPDSSQPAGYFENLGILGLHEEILRELKATWFAPPTASELEGVKLHQLPRIRAEVEAIRSRAGGRPVVIKDPRISGLLGLWADLIGGELHPVLTVRDPIEIAYSLEKRDGTPTVFSLAAWELHTRRALAYLNGRHVTVSPYAALMADPGATDAVVSDVIAQLHPAKRSELDPGVARHMPRPGLYRNHATAIISSGSLTGSQAELWEYVRQMAPGGHVLSVPAGVLDRDEHAAVAVAELEQRRTELDQEIIRLSGVAEVRDIAIIDADAQHATEARELRSQAADLRAENLLLADHNTELTGHLEARDALLRDIGSSASWKLTGPLRAAKATAVKRRQPLNTSAGTPSRSAGLSSWLLALSRQPLHQRLSRAWPGTAQPRGSRRFP
jgi:hypothetical protein